MTKKINLKESAWCVRNDGSDLFKETAVKWFNNLLNPVHQIGDYKDHYYGIVEGAKEMCVTFQLDPFGTELSITEFIELAKDEVESTELVDERQWLREHKEYNDTGYLEEDTEEHPDKSEPVKGEWISVKDKLPPKATLVQFVVGDYDIYIGMLHHGVFQVWGAGRDPITDMDVTYWQFLQPTPQQVIDMSNTVTT